MHKERSESRKTVAISSIGWLVHLIILAIVLEIGEDESYYGFDTKWRPDWIVWSILSILTIPSVLFLFRPSNATRRWLLIPAIAHLPFIHFGTWFSMFYFFSVGVANTKTKEEIQLETLDYAANFIKRQDQENAQQVDTGKADPKSGKLGTGDRH